MLHDTTDQTAATVSADAIDPSTILISDPSKGGEAGKEASASPLIPPSPPSPMPMVNDAGADTAHGNDISTFSPPDRHEEGEGGKEGAADPASPASPPSLPPIVTVATPHTLTGNDVYRPAPAANPVVSAAMTARLYRHATGDSAHVLVCPWAEEHGEGEGSAATYREPTYDHPLGHFQCPHTHSEQRSVADLIKHLEVSASLARCKPTIRNKKGEIHRVVDAAEQALADHGGCYQSNGAIVSLHTDPNSCNVTTIPVGSEALTLKRSEAVGWENYDGRSKDWTRCDVPPRVITTLLKSQSYKALPVLNGLARQPYLRQSDGGLVATPGYDPASGIYSAFDRAEFDLPEPTKANTRIALAHLQELLAEFHFDSVIDRSATVSAMLTASIRTSLPLAPAFSFSASSPGSGKSYLAALVAGFAGLGSPSNVSYPSSNDEATKTVESMFRNQPAAICFDDMPGNWFAYGAINKMLTSPLISERLLGSSQMVTVPTTALVMGTCNNIRPQRDLNRRIVSVYLTPKTQSVATIRYTGRSAEKVRDNRGFYVSQALTIIRAWQDAGKPTTNVPDIASFGEWSQLCRQPLLWLGEPDPASSLIKQLEYDPDLQMVSDLAAAWFSVFRNRPVTIRDVLKRAETLESLEDALEELPCNERGFINRSKLGRFLSRYTNRHANGYQFRQTPTGERNAWTVVKIGNDAVRSPSQPTPDDDFSPEGVWLTDSKPTVTVREPPADEIF